MNTPARIPLSPAASIQWEEAEIGWCLDDGAYRLTDGRLARRALSCLVAAEPGDHVIVLACSGGPFVTHVLSRESSSVQLSAPGAEKLTIAQAEVEIGASRSVSVTAGGTLSLASRHMFTHASETLAQNARHMVTHVQHCVMQVAALLRIHGKQTLITADHDMKLDADRVTLG